MKKILTLLLIAMQTICTAQNLVPNPGFENYNSLPCDFIITSAEFESRIQNWTVPNFTTPDLCSPLIPATCRYGNPLSPESAGSQIPRTGNVMIGMACENAGYNEYLQVRLTSPLTIGNFYQVKMFVSLAGRSDFANNDIGVSFSETIIRDSNYNSANFYPQLLDSTVIADTANWILISNCFQATRAWQYLIIGNFPSPCMRGIFLGGGWPMAYYFFDDISVEQVADCSITKFNCSTQPHDSLPKKLKIYPNPFIDHLIIENGAIGASVEIWDVLGRKLLAQKVTSTKMKLDLPSLPGAQYILRYREDRQQQTFKLVKL